MASSWSRLPLVALEALVSLTGIGGGFALASGLEGGRFPLGLLHSTPFSSYVIPGLILAVFVGWQCRRGDASRLGRPARCLGRFASVRRAANGLDWR